MIDAAIATTSMISNALRALLVQIPNGLGTFLGLVQLIIYGIYYRSTPKDDGGENDVEMPSS